jgi:hypothetical protein
MSELKTFDDLDIGFDLERVVDTMKSLRDHMKTIAPEKLMAHAPALRALLRNPVSRPGPLDARSAEACYNSVERTQNRQADTSGVSHSDDPANLVEDSANLVEDSSTARTAPDEASGFQTVNGGPPDTEIPIAVPTIATVKEKEGKEHHNLQHLEPGPTHDRLREEAQHFFGADSRVTDEGEEDE